VTVPAGSQGTAVSDIRRVTDIFNAFGDRFDIFCGVDDLIVERTT
jgi:4-hydroxy-tetrahydrodipicolinate synthase